MKTTKKPFTATIFGFFAIALFFLFLIRGDVAIDYMKTGLKLCAGTVIPSLFPFTVISTVLISSGAATRLCRPFAPPSKLIFGIWEGGACAFLLGTICGFPLGTKALCDMYDRGAIKKQELERSLTFCNNPGSAFVISAVGISLFGSIRIGIMLYLCVIISAIIVGILGRFVFVKETDARHAATSSVSNLSATRDGISIFTDAVRDSALSMLSVSAMIVFFCALSGCIGSTLSRLGARDGMVAFFSAFFEMSGGVSSLSALPSPLAVIFCAAALGWSGLSAHFQVMSLCAGRKINFLPYLVAKSLQSALSGALAAIFLKISPISEDAFLSQSNPLWQKDFLGNSVFFWCVISAALGVAGGVCLVQKSRARKKSKKS